ncbi:MAG: type III pantothenate kinase [Adlercreutzia sp.]
MTAVACVLASSTPSPAAWRPSRKAHPAPSLPMRLCGRGHHRPVIPALTGVWADAAASTDARPLTVGPGLKWASMNFSDPVAVGADRVAEMVGAKSTYGAPALVIDLGTSTTFELLDETGAFRGGIIAPGMKLGAQALARGAAQLAAVELRAPKSLLGRTTVEAMQAGIVMGEVARIDGLIDMIWADCGYTTPVILVGQDAETIAALMAHAVTVDQTLALRGLLELYTANTRR